MSEMSLFDAYFRICLGAKFVVDEKLFCVNL